MQWYVAINMLALAGNETMSIVSDRYQNIFAGKTGRIASGHFISVAAHQDKVYSTHNESHQTQVFQHNHRTSPRWQQLRSIDHDFETKGYTLTLSISNNQLKCSSARDGVVKVYSLSGELLRTYGTRGSGDAGRLDCPYISDDDDDGSVLIVDQGPVRQLIALPARSACSLGSWRTFLVECTTAIP